MALGPKEQMPKPELWSLPPKRVPKMPAQHRNADRSTPKVKKIHETVLHSQHGFGKRTRQTHKLSTG